MSVFKTITPNDIHITPFEVHKNYQFTSDIASSSYGVYSYYGDYEWWITNQADLSNTIAANLEQTTDDRYKYIIHSSINHMFYDKYRYEPLSTLSKTNIKQYRELHEKVKILSIPQKLFAEKIKEGTVNIIDNSVTYTESLVNNGTFSKGSDGWYSGLLDMDMHTHVILNRPIQTYNNSIISYTTKTMFIAAKSVIPELQEWTTEYCISSSLLDTIYSGSVYKLVIDIDYFSNYYPSDVSYATLNYATPAISTMSISITGSGGSVTDILVPLKKGRYVTNFSASANILNPKIILYATQSISYHLFMPEWHWRFLVSGSQDRIVFNEIGIYRRGDDAARIYKDDGNGNLYDTKSNTSTIDTLEKHILGEWCFNDGYIDHRDERRLNSTEDTSIYMNHGMCTNVSFVDGIYGKSAKFNNVEVVQEILPSTLQWEVSQSLYLIKHLTSLNDVTEENYDNVPLYESSIVPFPWDSHVYILQKFYNLDFVSLQPLISSPLMTLEADKTYRFSFWVKSTYTKPILDFPPVLDIYLVDSQLNIYYSDSMDVFGGWERREVFISGLSTNSYYIIISFDNKRNLISDYDGYDNENEKIYITNLKVEEVKLINNIRIRHNELINFKSWEKFALECIVKIPDWQRDTADNYNIIVTKNGMGREYINTQNTNTREQLHNSTSGSTYYLPYDEMNVIRLGRFPYQIAIANQKDNIYAGRARVSRYDGNNELVMYSSTAINDSAYHHLLFQKTGSNLELYVDGNLEASIEDFAPEIPSDCSTRVNIPSVENLSDLFIGSRGDDKYVFTGEVACVRIYNTSFNRDTIATMSADQIINYNYHYRVGNVFYDQGFITLTNPYARYADTFVYTGSSTNPGYTCQFKNNLTYYEVEVHCSVEPSEFNFTLNKTCRAKADYYTDMLACFATHSQFCPYVTTIGLYNENAELVAVGKLSKPVKKLNNVETTFIVRFDI